MGGDLAAGMVPVFSLWGLPDMGWLDGPTGCTGGCNVSASAAAFSDIAIDDIEEE